MEGSPQVAASAAVRLFARAGKRPGSGRPGTRASRFARDGTAWSCNSADGEMTARFERSSMPVLGAIGRLDVQFPGFNIAPPRKPSPSPTGTISGFTLTREAPNRTAGAVFADSKQPWRHVSFLDGNPIHG